MYFLRARILGLQKQVLFVEYRCIIFLVKELREFIEKGGTNG